MINSLDELVAAAKSDWMPTMAVADAEDSYVLDSVRKAKDMGLANAILLGDSSVVRQIADNNKIDISDFDLINCPGQDNSCPAAVGIIREGGADVLMKGLTHSATILRAILNRESGLRTGRLLSHIGVFQIEGMNRLLYVTDAALNIAPDVETKMQIISNAVDVANLLDNENPVVACVSALEQVNPKMPGTVDANMLHQLYLQGQIPGCRVIGPVALDNAISEIAAQHKHITMDHIGKGEILLAPNIEAGNILYKALVFVAKARSAGLLFGAKVPVVMTSRADTDDTKINSIALAILAALKGRNTK